MEKTVRVILILAVIGGWDGGKLLRASTADVDTIRFDVVIIERTPTPNSFVTLFGRYWVTQHSFNIAVIWAEPHGPGLTFPIYPPTLQLSSEAAGFRIHHDVLPWARYGFEHSKAIPEAFTNMYGDFPIANIRFAQPRTEIFRIPAAEFDRRDASHDFVSQQLPSKKGPAYGTNVVFWRSNKVESVAFNDSNSRTLRVVSNVFGLPNEPNLLAKQTIVHHERSTIARLPGDGITVRNGESSLAVSQITVPDLPGGRSNEIAYAAVKLGGKTLSFPTYIAVRSGKGGLLREARFTNFMSFRVPSSVTALQASLYAGFGPHEEEYRKLLERYWNKPSVSPTTEDTSIINTLVAHFRSSESASETVGQSVRRSNILMELARIVHDNDGLRQSYRQYLQTLFDHGLYETILVGGQSSIDTLAFWGRSMETPPLVEEWIRIAARIPDTYLFLSFAEMEIRKGNLLTTISLLDGLRSVTADPSQRFEIDALHCVALNDGRKLLVSYQKPGSIAFSQQKLLMAYFDERRLEQRRQSAKADAHNSFRQLTNPTDAQRQILERAFRE